MIIETAFAPGFTPPVLRFDATAGTKKSKAPKMEFTITDDPYMRGKYNPSFLAMKPGECIKCAPKDVKKVREAMREWIKRRGLPYKHASTVKYPTDGLGRVWLLKK